MIAKFDPNDSPGTAARCVTVGELIDVLRAKDPSLRVVVNAGEDHPPLAVIPENIGEGRNHCLELSLVVDG